jgi:hypothetical protein
LRSASAASSPATWPDRLEILRGAGHLLPMRTAAAFDRLLAGFLDSLQR